MILQIMYNMKWTYKGQADLIYSMRDNFSVTFTTKYEVKVYKIHVNFSNVEKSHHIDQDEIEFRAHRFAHNTIYTNIRACICTYSKA